MHTCAILKPCVIANMIYFLFVLGGFYPLFLEVDADDSERKNAYGYFFSRTF